MDFITIVNNIASDLGDSSSTMITRIKRAVNRTQQDVCKDDYDFLLDDSAIQCTDDYKDGTVAVTQGSATVTGTATTFTSAMVGLKVRFAGSPECYTISAYVSPTEITLGQSFVGTSISGITYVIYQDVYSLGSSVNEIINITSPYSNVPLSKLTRQQFDNLWPNPVAFGRPLYYTEAGSDSSGYKKIQLYNIPDSNYLLYSHFRKQPSDLVGDNDISPIPSKYHELLELGGKTRILKVDEDENAVIYDTDFNNMMEDLKKEFLSSGEDHIPTMGSYSRSGSNASPRLDGSHFRN